jgi:hypothetical protein
MWISILRKSGENVWSPLGRLIKAHSDEGAMGTEQPGIEPFRAIQILH